MFIKVLGPRFKIKFLSMYGLLTLLTAQMVPAGRAQAQDLKAFESAQASSNLSTAADWVAEDLLSPETQIVPFESFIKDTKKAGLISVGETHQSGKERALIKRLYEGVFGALGTKPACLVETFNLLFTESDPSTPLFKKSCRSISSLGRLSVGITDVEKPLADALSSGGPVVIHTGFRHVMPMGAYYPNDFTINGVDTIPRNTISGQLPAKFKKNMVSLFFMGKESTFENMIISSLSQLTGQENSLILGGIQQLQNRLQTVFTNPLWNSNEFDRNLFKLKKLQSESDPIRKSYLQIVDDGPLKTDLIQKLLSNNELVHFLAQTGKNKKLYGGFVNSENAGLFGSGRNIKKGAFYVFSSHYFLINPDGSIETGEAKFLQQALEQREPFNYSTGSL